MRRTMRRTRPIRSRFGTRQAERARKSEAMLRVNVKRFSKHMAIWQTRSIQPTLMPRMTIFPRSKGAL